MENPILMDDLVGKPAILGNTHFLQSYSTHSFSPESFLWIVSRRETGKGAGQGQGPSTSTSATLGVTLESLDGLTRILGWKMNVPFERVKV